nr:immunoglobulin light chain junction region [Macaca mulatta]MOX36895.1 immunoglobulin light chain junction region [Macaca mulatta]
DYYCNSTDSSDNHGLI